jgi:imidazolonepropionase-like amidohydrolase/ABC-type multidrug transport system permease subunit
MKPYIALIRNDIRLAFRQKMVIFFNYLMPLVLFFVFAQSNHAEQGGAILQILTMVIVIGILGNGLFGAGMRAVQERETNILRRYKVAPITPLPLLVASTITGLVIYMPCVILILVLSTVLYHMVPPSNLITVLAFVMLGIVSIRSIGLIIASVVNSAQESIILVQLTYLSMLFLSGATFPPSMFPDWLLIVTQFIPATYLVTGMQGLLLKQESLASNWLSVLALLLTAVIGLFISMKIFRWEKEEKMRPAAKLWVLAVVFPFVVLGCYQAYARDNVRKTKILARQMDRLETALIRNARIVTGTGRVIENGAILVKDGKIAEIYDGNIPDPKSLNARAIEAAGKTILPGLIDVHVHLGASGGLDDYKDYDPAKILPRELAAYLYSGVTAVKSVGDMLDIALQVRQTVNSGEKLGAEFFMVGPLFTTAGGHGTEYFKNAPEQIRTRMEAQFVRTPKTPEDAKQDVDSLKKQNVDGIKAVMEAGAGDVHFDRMDPQILNAIAAAARADNLPLVVHTGDTRDIEDSLKAGVNGIEHGSFQQRIPDSDFALMAKNGVTYDPTLSVAQAFLDLAAGRLDSMSRSLVLQAVPTKIVTQTRDAMNSPRGIAIRNSIGKYPIDMAVARDNLVRAWKAGVPLVTGTDAGNLLVFHGPTVQHEIALWVEAGIPVEVAIQAATLNAAKSLRAADRFGSIEIGKEATLLVVDGNPLTDVKALEAISFVMFKGDRISRTTLFDQE